MPTAFSEMTPIVKKVALRLLASGNAAVDVLRPSTRARRRLEVQVEERLSALPGKFRPGIGAPPRRTLVDGMWFNPNFLYRFSLLRTALDSSRGQEIGLLGEYSMRRSAAALRSLGIGEFESFADMKRVVRREAAALAEEALSSTRCAANVLDWRLPGDLPADFVYDGILKRQRTASVDIGRADFRETAVDAFAASLAAVRLIDRLSPEVVMLSHTINFDYAAVAWAAMKASIPTYVLFGNYGVPRFYRIAEPSDVYGWNSGPTVDEIEALTPGQTRLMQSRGAEYLARRLRGRTDDIGGQYAFSHAAEHIDRAEVCRRFGWAAEKPIVAVYANNWFDFPHACGMTHFRDFLDWSEATLAVAQQASNVNWLLKAHPCDQWYGGVTLRDLLPESLPEHMALAPFEWNGADLMAVADAMVTVHSTGGLEFACQGKPVLLADRGWYDKAGFAVVSASREDYLATLRVEWWRATDLKKSRERALVFAGMYFCCPDWQEELLMADDSRQDALWSDIARMLDNEDALAREIETVVDWVESGRPRLHYFKMLREADSYSRSPGGDEVVEASAPLARQ
jgi:hypothetical protein